MFRALRGTFVVATLCVTLIVANTTHATPVEYTIDSGNSYLDVVDFPEQFSGSGRLSFEGTLDVDFDTGTIQLLDTSSLSAILQPYDVKPAIGGGTEKSPGCDPGNAGVVLIQDDTPVGFAALRDITSTLFSDPIAVTDGTFPVDGITVGVITGSLDYNLVFGGMPLFGSSDLSSSTAGNVNEGVGGLFSGGDIIAFPLTLVLDVGGFSVTLDGQIQAFVDAPRPVPEPGSLVLLSIGLIAIAPYGLRRLRR